MQAVAATSKFSVCPKLLHSLHFIEREFKVLNNDCERFVSHQGHQFLRIIIKYFMCGLCRIIYMQLRVPYIIQKHMMSL